MPKIKPFNAVIYNQDKVKDLSSVVCPPYDVISPAKQDYYHQLSQYNLIRVLLGKDTPDEDKYQRAGNLFRDWLKEKILIRDDKPAIYFYSHEYKIKGENKTRFGLIALLRLDEKKSSVFGHEHTHLQAKEDRFRLIKQVKANLSPIFVLFSDKKRIIQKSHDYAEDKKAFIDVSDDEKSRHKLWRIDSSDLLDKIQLALEEENIFIADGHHRYEVACAYRDEVKKRHGPASGEESFNYVLAYFTNIESRGLTILPIHRLVRLPPQAEFEDLKISLRDYFHLEEIKDKSRFFFLLRKAGSTEHVLGMYSGGRFWLLRLKNIKIIDKMMEDKPLEYRSLDVSILNAIVLNRILKLDPADKEKLLYSADEEEFIRRADTDNNYVAFFLNPVRVEQITAVALKGEKMPPKSTYFYPKVLSGLAIHKHEIKD